MQTLSVHFRSYDVNIKLFQLNQVFTSSHSLSYDSGRTMAVISLGWPSFFSQLIFLKLDPRTLSSLSLRSIQMKIELLVISLFVYALDSSYFKITL